MAEAPAVFARSAVTRSSLRLQSESACSSANRLKSVPVDVSEDDGVNISPCEVV
jgi:hypothetical protein